MMSPVAEPTPDPESSEYERRSSQIRRYTTRVTIMVILLCNILLVAGIWVSGIDLNKLINNPDIFNPTSDVCVRLAWHRVDGLDDPVRLCSEWINLSDASGRTHVFQPETAVLQDADGNLYFDHGPRVGYRLLIFVSFVLAILALGLFLKRVLVARYRLRMETEMVGPSSVIH